MARLRPWLALLLAAFVAGPAGWSATGGPVLEAADAAWINGRSLAAGTHLPAGARVTTGESGSATLAWASSQAELGHKTVAAVAAGALALRRGYVRVHGTLAVAQGRYRTVPQGASEYELVLLANGRAYLHTISGTVTLDGFSRPIAIKAGTAVTYSTAQQGQDHPVKASDQAPASHTVALIAVAAVAAAALAAGLALHSGSKSNSASPTQP